MKTLLVAVLGMWCVVGCHAVDQKRHSDKAISSLRKGAAKPLNIFDDNAIYREGTPATCAHPDSATIDDYYSILAEEDAMLEKMAPSKGQEYAEVKVQEHPMQDADSAYSYGPEHHKVHQKKHEHEHHRHEAKEEHKAGSSEHTHTTEEHKDKKMSEGKTEKHEESSSTKTAASETALPTTELLETGSATGRLGRYNVRRKCWRFVGRSARTNVWMEYFECGYDPAFEISPKHDGLLLYMDNRLVTEDCEYKFIKGSEEVQSTSPPYEVTPNYKSDGKCENC
eukprot:GFYU01001375.1.p1 GENE.GFYU01001375.1~~GFYU01001375.1.p1  ORF type:complete len:282 (+),score=97.31 GFYU01001375.1:279-1124(+)